jgi:hypothetical protein
MELRQKKPLDQPFFPGRMSMGVREKPETVDSPVRLPHTNLGIAVRGCRHLVEGCMGFTMHKIGTARMWQTAKGDWIVTTGVPEYKGFQSEQEAREFAQLLAAEPFDVYNQWLRKHQHVYSIGPED